ncbi:MAG TPA: hypothetical protein PKM72_15395, partial [Nitrospirales bacterium]|nr:hypothetical protein [Nitrospirales bacterium]
KPAVQISTTLVIPLDKNVLRRILASHYHPDQTDGPSCLTCLGHTKDSLWGMYFFRCESLPPKWKRPTALRRLLSFLVAIILSGIISDSKSSMISNSPGTALE